MAEAVPHTYRAPVSLLQDLRIPQAEHQLSPDFGVLWHLYSHDTPPQLILLWPTHTWGFELETGDFVVRLEEPLAEPVQATLVLTGIRAE